jgi:hypothetical protein
MPFTLKIIKIVLEKGITVRPMVGQVNKGREAANDCDVTVLVLENFQSKYDFTGTFYNNFFTNLSNIFNG